MLTLHPRILEKNGVKEYAILPFDEFEKLKAALEDYQDLKDLRKAKAAEKKVKGCSLSDAKKQLKI